VFTPPFPEKSDKEDKSKPQNTSAQSLSYHTDLQNTLWSISGSSKFKVQSEEVSGQDSNNNNQNILYTQAFDPFGIEKLNTGEKSNTDLNLPTIPSFQGSWVTNSPVAATPVSPSSEKSNSDDTTPKTPSSPLERSTMGTSPTLTFSRRQYNPNQGIFLSQDPITQGISYNPLNTLNSNVRGNNQLIGTNHQDMGNMGLNPYTLGGQNSLSSREWDGYMYENVIGAAITGYQLYNTSKAIVQSVKTQINQNNPNIKNASAIASGNLYNPDYIYNQNLAYNINQTNNCKSDTIYPYNCKNTSKYIGSPKGYDKSVSPTTRLLMGLGLGLEYLDNGYNYIDGKANNTKNKLFKKSSSISYPAGCQSGGYSMATYCAQLPSSNTYMSDCAPDDYWCDLSKSSTLQTIGTGIDFQKCSTFDLSACQSYIDKQKGYLNGALSLADLYNQQQTCINSFGTNQDACQSYLNATTTIATDAYNTTSSCGTGIVKQNLFISSMNGTQTANCIDVLAAIVGNAGMFKAGKLSKVGVGDDASGVGAGKATTSNAINPLENASQISGRFSLENGPKNGVLYRATNTGQVTSYAVYDANGFIIKRVDVIGKSHNGVATPHVIEYPRTVLPDGTTRVQSKNLPNPRPAITTEIP
jgi:hypothetical protein